MPTADGGEATEDVVRIGERGERPHRKRLGEELLAKLAGPADLAERGVQDRDAVAESFGLIEAVGGEEDRDATRAKLIDQFVDVAGGGWIQAGGRLVEKKHFRVAEQDPCQGDPLS